MAHDSHASAFRRNVKWQMAGSASQAALSGLVLLVTGRELGTGGFGTFSIIMGFVYVANLLLEPRIQDVAAKQFWNLDREPQTRQKHAPYFVDLFLVEATGKLLPFLALVILAPTLARTSKLPAGSAELIAIAAGGYYMSRLGYGLTVGLLRVLGRSDLYAYCVTTELALRLVLTLVWVACSQLTVLASIAILCAAGIAANALQWRMTIGQYGGLGAAVRTWRANEAAQRIRENRRLLLSNLGLSASDLMNKDLDVTLISPFIAHDQVGLYKMAKNITLLTWRAIDPFYLALMPELNRLVALGDRSGTERLLRKSAAGLAAMAVALAIGSYLLVRFFGQSLLGPAYAAIPGLMPWMLVAIVSSAPLVWGHPLSVALGRADLAFAGSLFGSLIGLVAFLLLTPAYGIHGAALAWMLSFMLNFVFTSGISYRIFRKPAPRVAA